MPRQKRRKFSDPKTKKITVKRLTSRTAFVVRYADGRRVETPYVEILGEATLYLDPETKEPTLRTEANLSLGQSAGACAICGGDTDDQHAHA